MAFNAREQRIRFIYIYTGFSTRSGLPRPISRPSPWLGRAMEGPGGLATQQEEAEAAALAAGRSRRPNGAPVPPPCPPIHVSPRSTLCTLWPPAQP